MGISPYIADVRRSIGTDLLLLPSIAVIPRDDRGRVLLVRQSDVDVWATIGGTIEPDEAPEVAARREAQEEAGIEVELVGILGAFGGPGYRVTYPHGDQASYVAIAYDAVVVGGSPRPDGDETTAVGWFAPDELATLELGNLNRTLLHDLGLLT